MTAAREPHSFDIHIHRDVEIQASAARVIELVGFMNGIRAAGQGEDADALTEIRSRLADCARALATYDAAVAAGHKTMTNKEWRAIGAAAPPPPVTTAEKNESCPTCGGPVASIFDHVDHDGDCREDAIAEPAGGSNG
jgi:hypothetical protein